ncbi:amyloid fiber anchoring/assembly protein TapA [Neobacillus sp. SAB-20_R2A]|uniref:amyloid fiber anchoring/assembly protein TapA n=1 Tax=Neobacillus sp. SAB-20_R2A TaxID=3120519 RepID=UPI003C6E78ED
MRKFRKRHRKLLIICNAGLIWYLFMFALINLTSNTNAIFTSQAKNTSTFQAKASWVWDKSSLAFTNNYGGDCSGIFAYIQNGGTGDMAIPSKYYVYYDPTENPVNPQGVKGELVFNEGIIPKMASMSSPVKLTYKPQKAGVYKFVAFQHPLKPGDNGSELSIEGIPVTFSKSIMVNQCTNK